MTWQCILDEVYKKEKRKQGLDPFKEFEKINKSNLRVEQPHKEF